MDHKEETHLVKMLDTTLDSKVKDIVAILQANHPVETSRVTALVEKKVEAKLEEKLKPIQQILQQQNIDFANFKLSLKPMIDSFNESEQTRIVATRLGSKIKTYSGWLTVVAGAGTAIWWLFVKVVKLTKI